MSRTTVCVLTIVGILTIASIVTGCYFMFRRRSKNLLSYRGNSVSISSFCTQTTPRCARPAGSHSCCVDHLATMLEALTEQMGPKIFILFGTLLAWKRYSGQFMIPYDDDLDTGILDKDEAAFRRVIPALEAQGFIVKLKNYPNQGSGQDPGCKGQKGCRKIVYPPARYYCMTYSARNSLHVDIAILHPTTLIDGTRVLVDAPAEWTDTLRTQPISYIEQYTTWIFPRDTILPVQSTVYLNTRVYRPNNPEAFLEYNYGPDYLIPHDRDQWGGGGGKYTTPVPRLQSVLSFSDNSDVGLAPVLIVNLEKDKERLHHLLDQCHVENLYAKRRGTCCDGPLTEAQQRKFEVNPILSIGNLRPEQKKCFLSHEMCWEEAAVQSYPTLIVEDDVSFPIGFKYYLKQITTELDRLIATQTVPPATVVRLGMGKKDTLERFGTSCFATTKSLVTGAWAYIVTPEAAKILLSITAKGHLQWPVDHFFNIPSDRSMMRGWRSGDKRIPGTDEYMFLELYYPAFKRIQHRYTLPIDNERHILVQELSRSMNESRSGSK